MRDLAAFLSGCSIEQLIAIERYLELSGRSSDLLEPFLAHESEQMAAVLPPVSLKAED